MNRLLQLGVLLVMCVGCCQTPPQSACERAEAHLKGCQHCGGTEPGPDGELPELCMVGFCLLKECAAENPPKAKQFRAGGEDETPPPNVPVDPDLPPIPPIPPDDGSEPDNTIDE